MEHAERMVVGRDEFTLLKEHLADKLKAHEAMDEERFASQQRLADERQQVITASLDALKTNVHSMNNKLTPIFALPERVEAIVDELKNIPRNKDLDNVTQTFTTRFDSFEQAQKDSTSRARWILGISVPILFAIAMAILKKVGWL